MVDQNDHIKSLGVIAAGRQKLVESIGAGVSNNLFDTDWTPALNKMSDGLRSCAIAVLYDAMQISTDANFEKKARIFLSKLDAPLRASSPSDPAPTHRHNKLQ